MPTLTLDAPAKINLALEVLGRRDDGFHALETVFQAIDLCDTLTVGWTPGASGIAMTTDAPGIPADATNLAWRAAQAWLDAGGPPGSITIHLAKRIPHGAGLGGGSSDAAHVLIALQRLAGNPLPASRLAEIALRLGSDVPFFLVGGRAHALGRGEILTPLPDAPPIDLTIIMPDAHLPTPSVFKAMTDAERGPRAALGTEAWRALLAGPLAGVLRNRMEPAARRLCPLVGAVLDALDAAGLPHLMSGSGAACLAFAPATALPPLPAGCRVLPTRTRAR